MSDLKLYILNLFCFTVSFTAIESWLKILLLAVSIGYTLSKWYRVNKDK